MNILNFELLRNQKYSVHNCRFSQVWEKRKKMDLKNVKLKLKEKNLLN